MSFFLSMAAEQPARFVTWIVLVSFSICLHEYAHALTAHLRGDDTAAEAGHLTLNPVVQMGWMSIIMLLVLGFAWGAVPVDERRLRGSYDPALVSAAGPLSNLILCFAFGALGSLALRFLPGSPLIEMMEIGAVVNGILFVLNIIPFPPLDGWRIAENLVPPLHALPPELKAQLSWVLLFLIFLTPLFDFVWAGGSRLAQLAFF